MSISAKAIDGCVSNTDQSKIYTTKSGSKYKTTPFTLLGAGCTWIFTSGTCKISPNISGKLAFPTVQSCPIDDYVWVILLFFGALGFVHVRKRNVI
ncbi:hypothetical protein GM921_17285 [Pedobacter sp. LMG 31464]|uniref:Uncharacterized protein n=1 Tax=Pedobacter planticolens TaxID=2679964 RepID=A0A923E3B0_9SPHI|nr:hypothetical protein [Pedobacter planticolens]MBB2147258.1 hypothetical protein [Pedobacter planticolens]